MDRVAEASGWGVVHDGAVQIDLAATMVTGAAGWTLIWINPKLLGFETK
jgi:hypothetical protein